MSLFDDLEIDVDDGFYCEKHEITVGDLVLYEIPTERFYISAYTEYTYEPQIARDNKDNQIVIGVSLSEQDLFNDIISCDVMMMNFLMAEALTLPFMYLNQDKKKFIQPYVKSQFKNYVKRFIKECPNYEKIKNLKIEMPTVDDLKKFKHCENVYGCISDYLKDESIDRFRERLEHSKVYALDELNMLCQFNMSYECSEDDEVSKHLEFEKCEFLCIFRNVVVREKGQLY